MKWKIFITLIICVACGDAIQQSWLCDDAFLSFRYAEHLSLGKGLVFNEGEYVEGYSNFLWTILLSLGMSIGLSPEIFSQSLGILFFVATLVALSQVGRGGVALCATAGALHLRIYATAGLESSLFWFLMVSLFLFIRDERPRLSGICVMLLILCRPEGLLFAPLAFFALPNSRKQFLMVLLPPFVLYFVWKYWYFSSFLPNTYWAKGNEMRWEQGWMYMLLFWKMYGLGLLGLLACTLSNRRINIFIFGFIVVLSLQLIKGGGGFMYARLALPILIYLLIALELWASTRIPSRWYPIAALICGVLFVIAPYPEEVRDGNAQGIVEEKDWYPVEAIEEGRSLGEELQTFLEGTDARIAILGAQAMVAYYAKAPFVLESMAGLTDRELARMPVQKKRIGHGQKATLEYMRQREIDVLLIYRNRVSAPPETLISLGNVEGVLIRYRSVLLNEWKKRGARFVDIPTLIDTSVQDEEDVQKLQELGSFLDLFYFGPSEDIQRQKELTKKISNLQE